MKIERGKGTTHCVSQGCIITLDGWRKKSEEKQALAMRC
jgi:hypothetical protein